MQAMIDTNTLISYLLSPNPGASATGVIIRAALDGRFTLLFTEGIAEVLDRTLRDRPDLARIPHADADALVASLSAVAEQIPRLEEPLPAIGRDRKDDFVIAHAVVAAADYLVSWDKDLRDPGQVAGVTIVSPPEFLQILRDEGRL